MRIVLEDGTALPVELDEGPAAEQLRAALPLELSMSRWGDEYYGSLPVKLPAAGRKRDVYEVGEVALWPPGNAFCIFFGPTPASHDDEPRMASPGIPLGRIVSGTADLERLGESVRMTLRAAKD
ncbi:MAG: hypothetical protein FIB05_15590 [Betaproteobacteria bacterium]|nr:hypothetical protein [Betaproteobacteria bacterium]